jgi:calpain-15
MKETKEKPTNNETPVALLNSRDVKTVEFAEQNLEKILNECKKTKKKFTDTKFPATQPSIGELYKGKIKWIRASELTKNTKLMQNDVDPNDIKQGGLGDCYFLSSLSILSEHPDRMKKIFAVPELEYGVFAANLFLDGIPTTVVVDDYIPCLADKKIPAFSRNSEDEAWVMLMEKVYAKCYGGYEKIEGGCTGDALSDLTGAPYQTFKTQGNTALPPDDLWKILLNAEKSKFLIAASVPDTPGVDLEKLLGLVEGHAYGILDVKEVEKLRLIQIRNPWGDSMEWNGDFSDNSKLWTESLKKAVNFQKVDDGTFWMSFTDFLKYYNDIIILYYMDDWVQSFFKFNMPSQKSTVFHVTVKEPTTFRVCFNQVRGTDIIHLRLSVTDSNNNVLGLSGKAFSSAEVICTSELKLAPGTYNAIVDVYSKDVEKLPRLFAISAYGDKYVKFSA